MYKRILLLVPIFVGAIAQTDDIEPAVRVVRFQVNEPKKTFVKFSFSGHLSQCKGERAGQHSKIQLVAAKLGVGLVTFHQ